MTSGHASILSDKVDTQTVVGIVLLHLGSTVSVRNREASVPILTMNYK